jgi:hypothetical protein
MLRGGGDIRGRVRDIVALEIQGLSHNSDTTMVGAERHRFANNGTFRGGYE